MADTAAEGTNAGDEATTPAEGTNAGDEASTPADVSTPVIASSSKACVICFEEDVSKTGFVGPITSSCDHTPNVHEDCIAESIPHQVANKSWDQINW